VGARGGGFGGLRLWLGCEVVEGGGLVGKVVLIFGDMGRRRKFLFGLEFGNGCFEGCSGEINGS